MVYFLGLLVLAYLLGSIPTGLVVARFMGATDPRETGSGNMGAANIFRLWGATPGSSLSWEIPSRAPCRCFWRSIG